MPERASALIVEGDAGLSEELAEALAVEGFRVSRAAGVTEAQAKAGSDSWDIAFVDMTLPDGSGYDVIRLLAATKATKIVALADTDTVIDRLEGYSRGVDIYLNKPVGAFEITAAARAVSRRRKAAGNSAGWRLESESNLLQAPNGSAMQLNEREFSFMQRIMETPGKPVERTELRAILAQNAEASNSRSLDMFVARFRKRLEDELKVESPILTVRSIGFLFQP